MAASLPDRPHLSHLKEQAEHLLRSQRSGEPPCLPRTPHLPAQVSGLDDEDILTSRLSLRDARNVIARQHGYLGWHELRTFLAESGHALPPTRPATGPGHTRDPYRPATRYIDELLRLRCAPDLLAARLFPNGREVTESLAAFHAASEHLSTFPIDDPSVQCFVIGDGVVPRTGAVFAHRSHWNVLSIDPEMYSERSYEMRRVKVWVNVGGGQHASSW